MEIAPPLRVWVMPESQVYHVDPSCPALHHPDRYYTPRKTTLEKESPRWGRRQRRVCKLCGSRA